MMLAVGHTQPCANFIQRNLLERVIRSSKYPEEEYDTTRLKWLRENGAQCDKAIQIFPRYYSYHFSIADIPEKDFMKVASVNK